MRNYKILNISTEAILQLFKKPPTITFDDLPDAEVVNVGWEPVRACWCVVIEHPSFEEVPMGGEIPTLNTRYTVEHPHNGPGSFCPECEAFMEGRNEECPCCNTKMDVWDSVDQLRAWHYEDLLDRLRLMLDVPEGVNMLYHAGDVWSANPDEDLEFLRKYLIENGFYKKRHFRRMIMCLGSYDWGCDYDEEELRKRGKFLRCMQDARIKGEETKSPVGVVYRDGTIKELYFKLV